MLEKLKLILGLTDSDRDGLLSLLLETSTQRLKTLLGGLEVPESLSYIVLNVTAARFNRIGSEGTSSHSVEGESNTFITDDFAEYMDDIQTYLDGLENNKRGVVKFL